MAGMLTELGAWWQGVPLPSLAPFYTPAATMGNPGFSHVSECRFAARKVDIRLLEKGNSDPHDARPVYYNHLDD